LEIISSPHTIGVCGIGQIGLSLGLTCWRSGYRVLLYDQDRSKLETAREEIERMDGWLTTEFPESKANYGTLECALDLELVDRNADLVLESIREDLEAKVSVFQRLSGAASRGAIICSCTSGLSISEMGTRCGYPGQLVGTHFWSPPHLMPLVEVIGGAGSREEVIQLVMQFCRSIGKEPVRVNIDVPGFIGNRMLHALWREAIYIVERGIASPEDVDTVAKLTFGLRQAVLGPLEHMDLAGLDLIQAIHRYLLADLAANHDPSELLKRMVRDGRLGAKSGEGFYNWASRDSRAAIQARDRQVVRELRRLLKENALGSKGFPQRTETDT
jgi:3-hydroxybutyryl-CoA dehydrogenase